MKKRTGTILLILLLIVFLSVLSGCGEKDTAEKPTTIIQTETTISAIPSPALTPTATPTPTSTPTPSPKPIPSAEDELSMAPDVAGLEKGIQDEIIVYFALEGNEYGIDVGEVAGTLLSKDIISVEGNQTGGIILDSRVVKNFLEKQTEKFVLPINANDLTKEDKFSIDYAQLTSYGINKNAIIVSFKNPIELINSSRYGKLFSRSNDLMSLSFTKNGNNFEIKDLLSLITLPIETNKSNEFISDGDTSIFNLDKEYLFGEKLGVTAKSYLIMDCISGTNVIDLDTSSLLKTSDGRIIFIFPEETEADLARR